MLKNYFKIAWRALSVNRVYSFINIIGLSVGMAVAMLVGLWIWDECSFDTYNHQYKKIAVVKQTVSTNGGPAVWDNVPFPLGEELHRHYSGDFKYIAMSNWVQGQVLSYGGKRMIETGTYFEPDGPRILDLTMLRGNIDGLRDPHSIFISRSVARTYFGETDPMNKIFSIDNFITAKVTGVYEDLPRNSSFSGLGFMATWQLFLTSSGWDKIDNPWRPNSFFAYVQLADHADLNKVSRHIRDIKMRFIHKDEYVYHPQLFLHPMSKWHLFSEFKNGVNAGGRIQYVWMFGIIGVFVLLLACINFMNLSTARSEKRAKEVGIRKAIGSLRRQLIGQFFSESLLVSLLAFVLALLLVEMALPFFNQVADKQMSILWRSPLFWLLGLSFCIITGLVAGSYPALYLSSFKPVQVLKGGWKAGPLAAIPRRVLVVLQFTVSVVLIIGTIVVFRQIQFAKDRNAGYSRDGLVMLKMLTHEIHDHFNAVKADLLAKGAIVAMAETNSPMTKYNSSNGGFDWKGKDPGLSVDFPTTDISFDLSNTVGWQFAKGRGFSRDFPTDSAAFVINETAARFMGMKDAVGETLRLDGRSYTIIGVVKDMIVESPYEPARPAVYALSNGSLDNIMVRLNPAVSAAIAMSEMEKIFVKYNPSQPFDYQFVDTEYARKFGDEERVAKLAGILAVLAVFISCLGLFALASFVAEQRTKEIGIRKVLGATVLSVWTLLSREFLLLVILSLLIAIPLAWYGMSRWLQHFTYRTGLSFWIFLAAALGALVITLLTVSWQAIRAAIANPVKSLRAE